MKMTMLVLFVLALCSSFNHNIVEANLNLTDIQPLSPGRPYYHYAMIQARAVDKFRGVSARINLQNPRVHAEQYSMALIKITTDFDFEEEAIGLGWAVSDAINGDNRTRIVGFWKVGNKGCYNTKCPGFVQVDKTINLGYPFEHVSEPGKRMVTTLTISQDPNTGHWWAVATNVNGDTKIGYWPKELFTSLKGGGYLLQYGGFALGTTLDTLCPPMGTGEFPSDNYDKSAYFSQMKVIESLYVKRNLRDEEVEVKVLNPNCYNVKNFRFQGRDLQYTMSYGGPGGNCGA